MRNILNLTIISSPLLEQESKSFNDASGFGTTAADSFNSNRFSSGDDAFGDGGGGGLKLSGGFDESFGSTFKPDRPADPFHAAAVATADPFGDKQRGATNNAVTPVVSSMNLFELRAFDSFFIFLCSPVKMILDWIHLQFCMRPHRPVKC